jgi:DNA polymerase-3 subunit gamma/tau
VLEIDGASNNGVDNIRDLRDNVRYAPSRDRYKIFIIDEVHMLSIAAFNALLKVLEEPPSHVIFIMATTERHKLPATILSRCQQFVFRTISPSEIQTRLREIADREGAKIDDRGLRYIVRAAEGSMRDAQSLLDQIIAFGGQSIADDDVRDVLGFIPGELLDTTATAIADQDSRQLLECIDIIVDQGLNIQQYVRECIGRMRDLLMMKLGLEDKVLGSADEKKTLTLQTERFSEQDLVRNFDMLLRLEHDLKWTSQPRLHLEAGLVKLARAGHVRDIEDVLREFRKGGPVAPEPVTAAPPPVRAPRPEPRPPIQTATPSSRPAEMPPAGREGSETERPVSKPASPAAGTKESAKEEPLVQRFLEVFRGDIAQVKPSKGEQQ